MRTRDPETGYIGQMSLGEDYGPDVRCRRCGGRGMVSRPVHEPLNLETILCLRCSDDWHMSDLLEKHGYVWSHKKWMAAFNEFCETKPKEIDIEMHNRVIQRRDKLIHKTFPSLFNVK